MINLKKAAIIAAISILFAGFIFSFIYAIYERPQYSDFCNEVYPMKMPLPEDRNCTDMSYPEGMAQDCNQQRYEFVPVYENGCVVSYECRTCSVQYEEARKGYDLYQFIMATVLGLVAVILSIYLPFEKDSLKEWILAGFLIGGLVSIFIGTIMYFNDANRIIKPIIMLAEIILVIFVAYMKIAKKK